MPLPSEKTMRIVRAPRVVLYPYGQPLECEDRPSCAEYVWSLGGDSQRIYEAQDSNLDHFCRYIQHFEEAIASPDAPAIVVLTKANPLGLAVINARRKLERMLPALLTATWVLYVDPVYDPFFLDSARKCGTFVYQNQQSLQWIGPGGAIFLIAMPTVVDERRVAAQA